MNVKNYLAMLFACLSVIAANAQTVQIGTGTDVPANTLYGPVYRYSATSTTTAARSNMLYTQAELVAAGIPAGATITAVEFNKTNSANFVTPATFQMLMANTTNTALATTHTWASVLSTHTQVYSSTSFNMPLAAGWVSLTLATPFVYTGGALEVATDLSMGGNGAATDKFQWQYTASVPTDRIVGVASAGATLNGTVAGYKQRPNIRITYISPSVCTSPPTPGAAAASVTTTCANQPVQLTLSGNSIGSGQTYQWQSSPTATGTYTNIGTAGNTSAITVNPTATAHYRVAVTCGTSTTYSTPVQVSVNGGLAAGTYTINAGAAASTTNFQSFNAALAAMNCGVAGPVVFNVVAGSGPYVEQLTLGEITGVSATNTITFNGNGNTLSFAGVTGARAVINFNGADFVTFNNLVITATNASFAWGVHVTNNSDNNTINNCTINSALTGTTAAAAVGIVMSGSATSAITVMPAGQDCDNNTFSNNTINGGYYGFSIVGTTAAKSNGNKIINNTVNDFYYYGIKVDNQNDVVISGNDVSRQTRADVSIFYGIHVDASQKVLVNGNRVHNPADADLTNTSTQYGIYITASDATTGNENVFSNNLIYNFTRGGAQYGIYNAGSDNTWCFHNTVVLNDATYANALDARGIYQTTAATGLRYENNIVMVSRSGGGDNAVIYMNTPATTFTSDRNIFIMGSTGAGANVVGFYNTLTYAGLLDWQSGTNNDLNSNDINPTFSNPANGNYAPTNAQLNNMGMPIAGVTVDITGAARSTSTPDVGAYEFTPTTPCATPTPGTTTVSSTTICGGGYLALSLTGNSSGAGQTYQWQRSATSGGTYTNIGTARNWAKQLFTPSGSYYYRAEVKCGTSTQYSAPVRVSVSATLAAGTYTINNTIPTGSGNYNSFNDAVDAMRCGIAGAIVFNVANGTYNEQIEIPSIFGTSATKRITFQSATGNPTNVTISYAATSATDNFVVKLNDASFISFKGLTMQNTGTAAFGRVLEYAINAANDSIVNCKLVGLSGTGTTNAYSVIFATGMSPDNKNNVFMNNTIENGAYGVYYYGSTTNLSENTTFYNNTFNNQYSYTAYIYGSRDLKFLNNTVNVNSAVAATFYGPYFYYCDDALEVKNNKITINTNNTTMYPMRVYYSDGSSTKRGAITNNVINVNTTGSCYGLYSQYTSYHDYYNNTVRNNSGGTTSYAAYLYHSSATYDSNVVRNNVFVNLQNTGYAMYVYNPLYTDVDYNNLYSTSANIVYKGLPTATAYPTLQSWRIASGRDMNSISYDPGFVSATNLAPDPANAASWSVNGRGIQIAGNNKDINGNNRSVTLTGGVPDLGAYEFTPTVIPPVATAVPATPVQGATQYFIFGQDTVASIDWSATGVLPTTLAVKQYSGTLPPQLLTSSPSSYMYFYTHIDMPTTTYDFTPNIRYKKPWLGAIQNESKIKMIRKLGSAAWLPYNGTGSTNNVPKSIVTAPGVANPGYFTGIDDDVLFFAFIYPGKRAFCPGGNVVLEANTGNNLSYRWIKDGNYITGATGASYTTTVGGVYEVEETKNGAIVNSDPVTVTMVSPPPAVIAATGNPVICVGGSVVLAANTGSDLTYQWKFSGGNIPLANGATYTANAVGTYTVEVTNPGCSTVSAPVDITTEVMPMATINPAADVYLCPGAATTLQAAIPATGINNVTAQWRVDGNDIPGATGNVFHTTAIGNYTVTLSSPNCPVSVSPGTNVFPAQAPVPVISRKDLTLTAQASFTSYQWFKDGVAIPGANQFFHTISENGVYTVEVSNGGCTGLSADYPVTTVGINDRDGIAQQINIYPNPAAAVVNIAAPVAVDITLTSVEGRIVLQAKNAKQINISALPEGAYIIKVMDGNGVLLYTQKLLKTSE